LVGVRVVKKNGIGWNCFAVRRESDLAEEWTLSYVAIAFSI